MATAVQMLDHVGERDTRATVRMWALIDYGDVRENAVVRDLSATGFGIETARAIPDGTAIAITIGASRPIAATVIHATHGRYGCRFDEALSAPALDALTRDGPFASAPPTPVPAAVAEPAGDRLPLAARAAIIVAAAAACWSVAIGAGLAVLG